MICTHTTPCHTNMFRQDLTLHSHFPGEYVIWSPSGEPVKMISDISVEVEKQPTPARLMIRKWWWAWHVWSVGGVNLTRLNSLVCRNVDPQNDAVAGSSREQATAVQNYGM